MSVESVPALQVNGVVVDFAAETLRDRAGAPVALRPQAFAVLRHLAANPNRLVTKDELMAAVWPGLAVTDDSLVQCVHDIRRALGDERHAILRTVPRRGYQLVLRAADAPASARPASRALAAGAAAALAVAAAGAWWGASPGQQGDVPLVAVLPFDAVGTDETTRLLAKGLTEDVITDLGRIPEFEVLASGATAGYRGTDPDPRAVGSALNAAFVVDGSIGRDADRVRVTAQLVDAGTGGTLWSDRWDRPAVDVFAVQSEIAETIATRLGGGAGLVQETGRNAARRKPPSNLNAYELYLLGTERLERISTPEVTAAIELLEKAVAIDPGFARAWIELSHSHGILAFNGVEPEANMAAAQAAADRALALDPSDAEAYIVVGKMHGFAGDFSRAKAQFDIALNLAPNAAEILTFYAGWASAFGEAEHGAELADRLVRLEPNFPMWKANDYAYAYFMAGRYEDVLAMSDRSTPESYYRDSWAHRAGALAALGRLEEARGVSAQAAAARPDLSIELIINDPSYSDAERQRYIDTLRPAGFPACATPEVLAKIVSPRRLPECEALTAAAETPGAPPR